MFRHRLQTAVSRRTYTHWFILSFIAGCVNAGGFLGAHRFVSHVTGFATLFGVAGANGNWDQAIGFLTVPLFFLFGVMLSAYLIDRREQRDKRPHYAIVMGLVCACLLLAALGGYAGWFGSFGSEPRLQQDYAFLALLCAASGLQNAAISTASGTTVRTTHLTGLTTDLGTGLVRALSDARVFSSEMSATRLRLGTILSFAFGSTLAAVVFVSWGYLGFLLPALLAGYCVWEALRSRRRLGRIQRVRRARG